MNILSKLACAVALSFSLCAASFADTIPQEKSAALFYAMSSVFWCERHNNPFHNLHPWVIRLQTA